MRVAVVAELAGQDGEPDGTTRLRRLGERLADRGHDVTVFGSRWWGGTVPAFDYDGLTYHAVTPDPDAPDRRFVTRLPASIRKADPDVIHATHDNPVAVLGASLAGTLDRTPLVLDWYDDGIRDGWRGGLSRVTAHLPPTVVAPSRLTQTAVRERGREDVTVVPDPIDMDLIRSVEPDQVADVVYARHLDDEANLESLLLALAELRTMGWTAAVIGDGPMRSAYESQAVDLRIDDRVQFLGDLPVEERLAVFKGAHVAVHTARSTPFATDLLRALACGCVGVVEYHAASSAHELVEGWDRGFRVTSEEELVDAIRAAADMERRAVDEDFASYDVREVLERYMDCYRELGAI